MDWPLVQRAQEILQENGIEAAVDAAARALQINVDGRSTVFALAEGGYDLFTGRYTHSCPKASTPQARWLLVVPEITRDGEQQLQDAGVNYIDGVGNAWLKAPGLLVRLTGKTVRPPVRRSGFSASETRLVMGLLASSALRESTTRALAAWAGVSQKTVAKTFDRLEADGFLERSGATVRARRYWMRLPALMDVWCHAYESMLLPRQSTPRRFRCRTGWKDLPVENVAGQWGEAAGAEKMDAGTLVTTSPLLYTNAPAGELVATLGLLPDPDGPVRVAKRFWKEMPFDPRVGRESRVAPHPVVIGDLRALHDARAQEAADEVFKQWKYFL